MNQTDTNIGASPTENKAEAPTAMRDAMAQAKAQPAKAKPAAKATARTAARPATQQGQREVVTFETAARVCPTDRMAHAFSVAFSLDPVDYHAVREATEEHLALAARALDGFMGEEPEKAMEMHMQRVVDSFVRSAHGAGGFYDKRAALARDAQSRIANEHRDEDRAGVDGNGENRAYRLRHFAAQVGLQAYALLAAAHGAVDAYAHVCGRDWKPYEGRSGNSLTQQAVALQLAAFDRR